MKKNLFLLPCLLFVLAAFFPGRLAAEAIKENDRIGWSADGNQHDPDDWGATAMALAIFAKQGWQNKLVHIDYNIFTEKQGKKKFGGGDFYEWQLVDWMKDSPCPEYRWVYSRLRSTAEHKHDVLDASDGGMAFVLATGDTDGNFNPKLRDFLGNHWTDRQTDDQ